MERERSGLSSAPCSFGKLGGDLLDAWSLGHLMGSDCMSTF